MINGHKWFTSGAVGAELAIVMCVTDPDAHPYARASMILVPTDNPGFDLVRPVSVMGHAGGPGHCEIRYEDCRVPAANLLGERGAGFVIAQDRLGPGRIHHCMRAIGTAERAIELMSRRANERETFGGKLADKQFVQDFIARSRMEVDQARLLTLYAAWKMDTAGKRAARQEISMIKVVAANVVMDVLDRAIQVHGALGMSDDTPLAWMWRFSRMLRVADGPDEVHKVVIARRELHRWAKEAEAAATGSDGAGTPAAPRARQGLVQAPRRVVRGLDEPLHDLRELLVALVRLAVLAGGVACVDALEDDGELPVRERDVEVDPGQVPAGCARVSLPTSRRVGKARGRGGRLEQRRRTRRPPPTSRRGGGRRPRADRRACRAPSRRRPRPPRPARGSCCPGGSRRARSSPGPARGSARRGGRWTSSTIGSSDVFDFSHCSCQRRSWRAT